MESSSRIEIEKFNGKKFELWKLNMEELLIDKEQWIAVDPGTQPTGTPSTSTQATGTQPTSTQTTSTPVTGMSKEDWDKLDRRARSTIRLYLADSVLLNVSGEYTTKELWDKCGKTGHYKKDCKSKKVEKPKGSDGTSSTEVKTSTEEGVDVYLASTSTHADHGVWLINSGASYHMTPHKEWFSEYEKYDGGDVFLGDDSTTKILGRGRVKLLLNDGRIITLPGVLHIPKLARRLISVSKLSDVGVKTIFEKDTCKMV
jgi:hypothetical protein